VDVATTVQIVTAASNIIFAGVFGIGFEADYSRLPMIDVVVRNDGGGAARDIEFEFSSPMMSSAGFVLSDLNYFRARMNFLEAGAEVRSFWDTFGDLVSTLWQSGPERGSR
jgi:hypothetical protein